MDWWLVTIALVAVVVLGIDIARRGRSRAGVGVAPAPLAAREAYTQVAVPRRFEQPTALPQPDDRHPLAPALARAVDATVPVQHSPAGGEAVPHSAAETAEVVAFVVARVNQRTPGLGLVAVASGNVRKTVDAYKTLLYQVDVHVHSAARGYSAVFTADVVSAAGGARYLKAARVHAAAKDTSGVLGSTGASPVQHESFAPWEPAVRF